MSAAATKSSNVPRMARRPLTHLPGAPRGGLDLDVELRGASGGGSLDVAAAVDVLLAQLGAFDPETASAARLGGDLRLTVMLIRRPGRKSWHVVARFPGDARDVVLGRTSRIMTARLVRAAVQALGWCDSGLYVGRPGADGRWSAR